LFSLSANAKKHITHPHVNQEGLMDAKKFAVVASLIFALISVLGTAGQVQAQGDKTPYPKMAPPEQYLMDRNAEIALARSAAPDSISRDAKILVLGSQGYETVVEGKNGFVCAVERGWSGPFDDPGFWNPKNRGPICYNPEAARSILPWILKRTELVLAGKPRAQIREWEKAASAKKELPTTVEPRPISYMISKEAYLGNGGDHNLAHLMVYVPRDKANWGADVPHSPVIFFLHGPPEPFTVFLIPVGRWSDGTRAPLPGLE
jgi:hypothetical protein